MATEIRMARLSPTMETGTINRWLVKEGDQVSSGDTLAEVETDKASMPLETFEEGKVLKILAGEGKTVQVDELIAVLGKAGEDVSSITAAKDKPEAQAQAAEVKPTAPDAKKAETAPQAAASAPPHANGQLESKPAPEKTTEAPPPGSGQAESKPAPEKPAPIQPAAEAPKPPPENGGRVKASPVAKRLARERGIDLESLHPSGPGGRIIERDIPPKPLKPQGATSAPATAKASSPSQPQGQLVPLNNIRQTIARRLSQSKQEIPHWYLYAEANVERLLQMREELNVDAESTGVKISVNDLIVKISATALRQHPEINASFQGSGIRRNADVNIAIAIATEEALYTPVLRNADRLSLSEISAGVDKLIQRTREKQLKPEDLGASSFTISNLGMYGVDHFFAIINPPEAAILAIGAIKDKPVVDAAGRVVAGKMMHLTLSCDHRVVDGALAARFMATLREYLERPVRLLL